MPQPRALFSWLLEAPWLLDSTVRCVYTEETTLLNSRAIRNSYLMMRAYFQESVTRKSSDAHEIILKLVTLG